MNVSVVGAGQMGNGIAQVFASKGHQVSMIDISKASLEKGLATISNSLDRLIKKEVISPEDKSTILGRISTHSDMAAGVKEAELVLEAATEDIGLKLKIFAQLDSLAPARSARTGAPTILASNTSSISITQIAAATQRPEQVIGMHFMNPVPIMKLVEVIKGYATSPETAQQVMQLSETLGKTPVVVEDYPGFVSNRILMPMINEAIHTLWEGVGNAEAIDTVMKLGMAHPMGPLQLADFIGLDTCLAILNVMYDGFGRPHYKPCPLLVNMVMAGKLGKKSGEGFYQY